MQIAGNWREASTEGNGGGHDVPAGGYVLRIVDVYDDVSHKKLVVTYDVAEGPNTGVFSDEWSRNNTWAHEAFVSYKETAFGLWKRFVESVEKSNPGFQWDNQDERLFIGKVVGCVLHREEKQDGRERLSKLADFYSIDDIRAGKFTVPPTTPYNGRGGNQQRGSMPAYNPGGAPQVTGGGYYAAPTATYQPQQAGFNDPVPFGN